MSTAPNRRARRRIRLAAVGALLMIGGACGSDPPGDASTTPTAIELLDGSTLALGNDRPVVVAFVAKWCAPCRRELPMIQSIYERNAGAFDAVAVGFQEPEESTRQLAEETGVEFDLASDPKGELFADFGFIQLPATVVVGGDGRVVESYPSGVTEAQLEAVLARVL